MVFPLILMWFFVTYMMIRAVINHQVLWPQKGEDKDEGGFEMKPPEAFMGGGIRGEQTANP